MATKVASTKAPSPDIGRVTVTVLKGRELIAADTFGKSDPYCTLVCRPSSWELVKTQVVRSTVSPEWNESFSFESPDPEHDYIEINVFDYDKLGKHDHLGVVAVPVSAVMRRTDGAFERWFSLLPSLVPGKPVLKSHGDLRIRLEYSGPKSASAMYESEQQLTPMPSTLEFLTRWPGWVAFASCVVAYAGGAFGFSSLLTALVAYAIFHFGIGQLMTPLVSLRARQLVAESERRAAMLGDAESVEWMNELLSKVWANFDEVIEENIKFQVDAQLAYYKPASLAELSVTEVSLGVRPPKLSKFKLFDTRNPTDLHWNLRMLWASDLSIEVTARAGKVPLKAVISNLSLDAVLSIRADLMPNEYPYAHIVKLQLLQDPNIQASVRALSGPNLMLVGYLERVINDTVSDLMVFPKYLELNIKDIMCPPPDGASGVSTVDMTTGESHAQHVVHSAKDAGLKVGKAASDVGGSVRDGTTLVVGGIGKGLKKAGGAFTKGKGGGKSAAADGNSSSGSDESDSDDVDAPPRKAKAKKGGRRGKAATAGSDSTSSSDSESGDGFMSKMKSAFTRSDSSSDDEAGTAAAGADDESEGGFGNKFKSAFGIGKKKGAGATSPKGTPSKQRPVAVAADAVTTSSGASNAKVATPRCDRCGKEATMTVTDEEGTSAAMCAACHAIVEREAAELGAPSTKSTSSTKKSKKSKKSSKA